MPAGGTCAASMTGERGLRPCLQSRTARAPGVSRARPPTSPWGPLLAPGPSDLVRDRDRVPVTAFSLGGTTGPRAWPGPGGPWADPGGCSPVAGRCWVRVPLAEGVQCWVCCACRGSDRHCPASLPTGRRRCALGCVRHPGTLAPLLGTAGAGTGSGKCGLSLQQPPPTPPLYELELSAHSWPSQQGHAALWTLPSWRSPE